MSRERLFRFKQFSVSHSASAMKVGTDGVTLGAWASVTEGDRVADVGAGCGLIGLMMAQRGAAEVTLIEIDPAAAAEAADNAAASPWADRVAAVCSDFNEFVAEEPFDRIVCNPPFFNNGEMAPDSSRAMARHESTLTLEDLLTRAKGMLTPSGTISIIIPADREPDAQFAATMASLHCCRRTRLFTAAGKMPALPRRILLEFSANATSLKQEELIIGSETYAALTSDFYL